MSLAEKYGLAARKAVDLMVIGDATSPKNAWEKAVKEVFKKEVYREKGCPRAAFLGLCEDGLIKNITPGNYTKSLKNKSYAVKAVQLLKKNPELRYNKKLLWEKIIIGKKISHNYQLDVVINLWENNLINL